MKNLILICSIIFCATSTFAHPDKQSDIITETFEVKGNCGECKERIEKAAYIKGVKRADWDKEAKKLTVTYKTSKTSKEAILKSVAASGHDAGDFEGEGKAYDELPNCCKYRSHACND